MVSGLPHLGAGKASRPPTNSRTLPTDSWSLAIIATSNLEIVRFVAEVCKKQHKYVASLPNACPPVSSCFVPQSLTTLPLSVQNTVLQHCVDTYPNFKWFHTRERPSTASFAEGEPLSSPHGKLPRFINCKTTDKPPRGVAGALVDGYGNSLHRGFETFDEAKEWMATNGCPEFRFYMPDDDGIAPAARFEGGYYAVARGRRPGIYLTWR